MNEFSVKKLGEVLAFARVGIDTIDRGMEGFRKLFTEIRLTDLKKEKQSQIASIESFVEDPRLKEILQKKADATAEKLKTMRNLYVKDEWDNPAELCEWTGFFEGAAIVHWTLVKGIAEGLQNKPLEELANNAMIFHEEILKTASLSLYNIGKEKSSS